MTIAPVVGESLVGRLGRWDGAADTFPYDAVMRCFRTCGKHFVPAPVLVALATARSDLLPAAGDPERQTLERFLDVALDKWDDRHRYPSYLGLEMLDLVPEADGATGRRQRDEWVPLLLADVLDFEIGARDGDHYWLPQQRPGSDLLEKRARLLHVSMTKALAWRSGWPPAGAADRGTRGVELTDVARRLLASAPARHRQLLVLGMQPVFTVHDEYLFIRVLQTFEVSFAAMAADMRDAVAAARSGDAGAAAAAVRQSLGTLSGARSLFSLLASMRAESFRVFRAYTVGASAIQSSNYKTFEALCSVPTETRLGSPGFDAVPQVRERVQGDWDDLTSAVRDAVGRGVIDAAGLRLIEDAVRELETVHQRWKRTHWRLASHMIGTERGTGYTVGVPYLEEVLANRLFAGFPWATTGEQHG